MAWLHKKTATMVIKEVEPRTGCVWILSKKKKKKRLLNIKKIQIGKYPSSVTIGAAVTSTARLFPHSGVRIQHRTKHKFVQSFSLCTVVWLNT